jgi:methionyl-tRNA formyltransferase
MQVGFAGTPAFAATALEAVLGAGFMVALVLTRPDRPRGRGLAVAPSPVKALAAGRGIPVLQPATLKDPEARAEALAVPLDVLVVAAYGLILPQAVLDWPRHGGLNIHASLLPRWRGAAPIERAILAGDAATGISIMRMDAGLDTGPVVSRTTVAITNDDTAGTLTARLAATGAAAIIAALQGLRDTGMLAATPQPADGATYAAKVEKGEAVIDWALPAAAIACRIRAFDPAPGATATLHGAPVKLWRATTEPPGGPFGAAGAVLAADAHGMVVACGEGTLRVTELQPAGKRRMDVAAFLAGHRVAPGDAFDVAPAAR